MNVEVAVIASSNYVSSTSSGTVTSTILLSNCPVCSDISTTDVVSNLLSTLLFGYGVNDIQATPSVVLTGLSIQYQVWLH